MHLVLVENFVSITSAKIHSAYLKTYPNDALLFDVMDFCLNQLECDKILYGDYVVDAPQLNRFKEGYGFHRWTIPQYQHLSPGIAQIKLALNFIGKARQS